MIFVQRKLRGSLRRASGGGSWANNQDNERAVYRNNNHPANHNNNIGFRCRAAEIRSILESMNTQTVTIEVAPQTAAMLQAKAEAQGVSLDELLRLVFETANGEEVNLDSLVDWKYAAECAAEADPSITLEEVREGLSKIPGSMTEDFRRERDER